MVGLLYSPAAIGIIALNSEAVGVRHRIDCRIRAIERQCSAKCKAQDGTGDLHLQHRTRARRCLRKGRHEPDFTEFGSSTDLRSRRGAGTPATGNRHRRIRGVT